MILGIKKNRKSLGLSALSHTKATDGLCTVLRRNQWFLSIPHKKSTVADVQTQFSEPVKKWHLCLVNIAESTRTLQRTYHKL